MGGQGRCEQRIEVFVKNKKKCGGGGGVQVGGGGGGGLVGGVRVDMNEELKFLRNLGGGGSGGGGGGGGSGRRGSGWM